MDSLNSTASSTPSPSPRSSRKSSTLSRPGTTYFCYTFLFWYSYLRTELLRIS
jgi:hypothetical protein